MSFSSIFQLALPACFFLATLSLAHATENIFGSDDNDMLLGTSDNDQILGGYGNDTLLGNDGDDILRGGAGDDVLRGGDGDDILYGGAGIDRLYGGPGADRFVFTLDATDIDEILDFNPDQNDIVLLQNKYTDDATGAAPVGLTADHVRVDEEGNVKVLSQNGNWTTLVKLHEYNLKLETREVTGALQLHFTRPL